MISHKQNIAILLSENVISKQECLDYEGFDTQELYDLTYQYCQSFLDLYSEEYGISPARMYFRNDMSINACASKRKGYYLIGLNHGTLYSLYSFFHQHKHVFQQEEFKNFKDLFPASHIKVNELLTVIIYQFLFYHEVAHLVQLKNETEFAHEECAENGEQTSDVLMRHVYEFDADWHGACKAAFFILDTIASENNTTIGKNILSQITALTIAGIVSHFIKSTSNTPLYFEQTEHPHNFIRLIYVTDFILPVIIHNTGIDLKTAEILLEVLKLVNAFFINEQDNPFKDFINVYIQNKKEINAYILRIKETSKTYDNLGMKQLKSIYMSKK